MECVAFPIKRAAKPVLTEHLRKKIRKFVRKRRSKLPRSGTFSKATGASVAYRQSENDPVYQLPVLKILGAMYLEGDMTLKFSEILVLDDMLKRNGGPPKK